MRNASNLILLHESDLLINLNAHVSPEKHCLWRISPGMLRSCGLFSQALPAKGWMKGKCASGHLTAESGNDNMFYQIQ